MITASLKERAYTSKPQYPLLAKCAKTTGLVVLFSSEKCGTVLEGGRSTQPVGTYCQSWYSAENANEWTILPEGSVVTLKQG